jgi:hypothetical protein
VSGTGECRDIERLTVARVGKILRPEQVPGRWDGDAHVGPASG